MFKNVILITLIILSSISGYSQTESLIVSKQIRLPADSLQSKLLISSINGFLSQAAKPNNENTFVLKQDLPETSALLDEIKGMDDGNGPDKKGFYKCYLTNVMLLDSSSYIVQFSYIGINESSPVLRANFKLIAKKSGDRYYLSSPLKRNTTNWRVKNVDSFSFYYQASFNQNKAAAYVKKAREFDQKLHAPAYTTQIYICDNLNDLLALLGVEYKSDYNGISHSNTSSFENGISLNITGRNDPDPAFLDLHDLWHDRLHRVVSTTVINKPVDEACAYLYAGSWGISWSEIFKRFKTAMGTNVDWLASFNENKNFGTSQQYHLYVSYVINALIVQQIEKEKGFAGVIELLSCGKKEKTNDNYFLALDKIAGINKANFNQRIQKLVDKEGLK